MTTTAATGTTPAQTTAQTGGMAQLSQDYTMFLKLLSTQMQNQDPLDPMDTSQYTQQLVQYSQVEQSIQQSGLLKDILGRLTSQDLAQASSLIGRQVQYDGATAGLTADTPARWTWTTASTPASLNATILDAAGHSVATIPLDPGATSLDWNGSKDGGGTATPGSYTLVLSASDADGNSIAGTVGGTGVVSSVAQENGALALRINGAAIGMDALRGIAPAT